MNIEELIARIDQGIDGNISTALTPDQCEMLIAEIRKKRKPLPTARVELARDRLWCEAIVPHVDMEQLGEILHKFNKSRDD